MKKLKTAIILLIAIGLLAAGAALPKLVAAVQDSATVNSISYGAMQSVALELSEEQSSLSIFEKLSLIAEGSFYSVAEESAALTLADVITAIKTNLEPYYYADLVPYNWTDYSIKAAPYFVYGNESSDRYCIIWVASLSWGTNTADYSSVELYVDDDTGNILYIQYSAAGPLDMYDLYTYADILSNAYFESLGMEKILSNPNPYGVTLFYEDASSQSGTDAVARYTMSHKTYGELVFEFTVYERGFYVMLE